MKIIGHKNRAIGSLKKTSTENVATKKEVDELDKPITRRELIDLNNKRSLESMVKSFTNDPKEQASIMEAYEKDIVKTGNIDVDFKKSLAIANAAIVEQYKKNEAISKQNENFLTNFSGGSSNAGNFSTNSPNDAIKRATAENLKRAGYTQEEIDKTLSKM